MPLVPAARLWNCPAPQCHLESRTCRRTCGVPCRLENPTINSDFGKPTNREASPPFGKLSRQNQ
nr:MAG TPA_asm: hypothetical protein [Caudoviricetes sp.]